MSSKHILVIDIGSNTIHADIFLYEGGKKIFSIWNHSYVLKLGRYLVKNSVIPEKEIFLILSTLKEIKIGTAQYELTETFIFATSILREAKNKDEIIEYVKQDLSLNIQILSTEEEGLLAFQSVKTLFRIAHRNVFVIDIGGGSCECIEAVNGEIISNISYPMGFSKMKEYLHISDKCLHENMNRLKLFSEQFFREMASSLNSQLHDVIVTSSVLKVIAIIQDPKRTLWDLRNVRIRKRFLSSVQKRILQGDPIYGLEDDKRDLVLMGTVFFIDLIEFLKKDSLRICPWSIREAYVLEYSKS